MLKVKSEFKTQIGVGGDLHGDNLGVGLNA